MKLELESLVDLCANVLCIHPEYVDMSLIPSELAQALWKKRYSHRRGEGWCWIFPYHIKEPVEWDPLVIVLQRLINLVKNYNNSFYSEKKRNEAGEKMVDYISTNARFITSKHFILYYIKQRILSFLAHVDNEKAEQTWRGIFGQDLPDPGGIVQIVLRGKRINNLTMDERKEAIKTLLQMLHRHVYLDFNKVDMILDKDVLGDMVRAYVKEFYSRHSNNPGPLLCPSYKGYRHNKPGPLLNPSYKIYGHAPHPERTNRSIIVHGRAYKRFITIGWHYDEDTWTWTSPEIV